jgi:hypothetical protein
MTREQALHVLLGAILVGCTPMPAEQPNPHGETLDTLRAALAQLQAAVTAYPHDPTLVPATEAVAQAVKLLASVTSSDEGEPSPT